MTNAKVMIRRFGLFWTRFSPLETRLLNEVRKVLPSEAQPIFDEQVLAIRRVIRLPPSWGEIDFFTRNHWKGVTPLGSSFKFEVRTFESALDKLASAPWHNLDEQGRVVDPDVTGRMVQYRASFVSKDGSNYPELNEVTVDLD